MPKYKGKQYECVIEQYRNSNGIYWHYWQNAIPINFDNMEEPTMGVFVIAIFKVKLKR